MVSDSMKDTLQVTSDEQDGKVFIAVRESKSGRYAEGLLDKETARQFSDFVGRAAYKAHYGVWPPDESHAIAEFKRKDIETKRQYLIIRVAHMLRDLQERNTKHLYRAECVVDEVLKATT